MSLVVGAAALTHRGRASALATALACALVVALVGSASGLAHAQEADAQQRQAAGEAFDRGTASYLARNYAQAAEWFETANRLAPAAPALVQAVRAHQRAGNLMRAGTLALRLVAQYPDDRASARPAQDAITAATSRYVRIDVVCAACTVDLDGTLQDAPSFFVEAGSDHRVAGHFSTGDREQTVRGTPGERRELRLEAPPPPPPDQHTTTDGTGHTTSTTTTTTPPAERPPHARSGLPPAVALLGIALTVGVGGITAWSGIDTLSGVDAYEANPTQAALDEGQAKELRTNILIGATAALGVATAVLAIFATDWGAADDQERAPAAGSVRASAAVVPGGAVGVLGGTF